MENQPTCRQGEPCIGRSRWIFISAVVLLVLTAVVLAPQLLLADDALAASEHSPRMQLAQDLSISKTHIGNFQIGSTGSYFITVTNVGTSSIAGQVTVTDILPTGLTPTQASGDGWSICSITGQTVTCTHPNAGGLASGTSLPVITLVVSVSQAAAPSVTNAATLTNINDTNAANNTASDPTTIVSADLSVTKTVQPTVPAELAPITYTLTVRNNGPSDTTGVTVTDTLPTGLTFLGAVPSRGAYSGGLWTIGNLANGESVTLRINAQVNAGMRGQTIVNTATGLRSDLYDYQSANNQASVSLRVASTRLIGLVSAADTGLPIPSATVVFTDSLNRVYNTTTAASGWYTFTETIDRPIASGGFSVRASRSGYRATRLFSSLTAGVDNRQDIVLDTTNLRVAKSSNVSTVLPGQTLTYTLAITNVGSIAASQVVITDVLPTYLTYITDTFGIAHTTPVAGTIVWRPTTVLAPNAYFNFRVRARVANALPSPTTAIVNTLRANTRDPEADLSNNSASRTVTSTGTPNIGITKSVFPSQVRTGQNATFTIVVNNTGNALVTGVTVVDTFSSFLDILSVTSTKGTSTTNATTRRVTVDIGVLNPNEVVTITVVVRVNSTATSNQNVTNTATISYVFGGTTSSKISNTSTFQLIATAVLPPTGGTPAGASLDAAGRSSLIAWISASVLGLIALLALAFGLATRPRGFEWSTWLVKMGGLFAVAALVFGFAAWGIGSLSDRPAGGELLSQPNAPIALEKPEGLDLLTDELERMPPSQLDDLPALPDFPVPTPTAAITTTEGAETADISAITRIVIPALGLDTEVKYVPFDGRSWMIAGLKQEVAWMGETSWPGLGSNTGLAGHVSLRSGEDGPFRHLDKLAPNDLVQLYTEKNVYSYRVRASQLVGEADLSVVQPTQGAQITLITCANWDAQIRYYVNRLVVFADLESVQPLQTASQGN